MQLRMVVYLLIVENESHHYRRIGRRIQNLLSVLLLIEFDATTLVLQLEDLMISGSKNLWKLIWVVVRDLKEDSVLNLADYIPCRNHPDFVCRMDLDLDIAVVDLVQDGVVQVTFVDNDPVRGLLGHLACSSEVHSSVGRWEYKVGWEDI
jgi:hypothetical protein